MLWLNHTFLLKLGQERVEMRIREVAGYREAGLASNGLPPRANSASLAQVLRSLSRRLQRSITEAASFFPGTAKNTEI